MIYEYENKLEGPQKKSPQPTKQQINLKSSLTGKKGKIENILHKQNDKRDIHRN